MSTGHIIFIPMMLAIGGLLGFILGARAARNASDLEKRRVVEREQARAERAAKKAATATGADK